MLLCWIVEGKRAEAVERSHVRLNTGIVGAEVALAAGEEVTALAGLGVDQRGDHLVRAAQHCLGMIHPPLRSIVSPDHDHEGQPDQQDCGSGAHNECSPPGRSRSHLECWGGSSLLMRFKASDLTSS